MCRIKFKNHESVKLVPDYFGLRFLNENNTRIKLHFLRLKIKIRLFAVPSVLLTGKA